MISNVLLYQIILYKIYTLPYIPFIKLKETIIYELHYRIDEDRIWYTKKIKGRLFKDTILDQHHTKNNLFNSFKIMEGILKRILLIKNDSNCYVNFYDIREENQELYYSVVNISKNIEKKENQINEPKLKGLLL